MHLDNCVLVENGLESDTVDPILDGVSWSRVPRCSKSRGETRRLSKQD